MSRIAAAAALACVLACGKYTPQDSTPYQGDGDVPSSTTNHGDGGQDAGTDAGTDGGQDAGCAQAFSPTGYQGYDSCLFGGPVTVFLAAQPDCSGTISFGNTVVCTGTFSGPADAFDGGCGALACSAMALPGRVSCNSGCSINVCAADAGFCSP